MGLKIKPWMMRVEPEVKLETIDWSGLKAGVDLRKVAEESLPGATRFKDFWCCPFHGERSPSLRVYPDHFHCFGCGVGGDVFDWFMRLEGLTRPQAAKRLDPALVIADDLAEGKGRVRSKLTPKPSPRLIEFAPRVQVPDLGPAWLDPEWQAAVNEIVIEAEGALWSSAGRGPLEWLRARGLSDTIIRRYRLGWNPRRRETPPIGWLTQRDGKPKGITVARGVVIPWLAPFPKPDWSMDDPPDRWVGANVRCLADPVEAPLADRRDGRKHPKTICLNGSVRGYLYPQPEPWPHHRHRPFLLVEGEIDALLGEQLLGEQLPVFSVGGASTRTIAREARVVLARSPLWLVCTDHDAAGVAAARWWKALNPAKARRVILPCGKDFAEFASLGGDSAAWLESIKAKPLHPVSQRASAC